MLVLLPRFDGAAALESIVTEHGNVFMGVPTMYIGLLGAARTDARRPTLRIAVSGGASLQVAVIDKFAATFGADIYEAYGRLVALTRRAHQSRGHPVAHPRGVVRPATTMPSRHKPAQGWPAG